MQFGFSMLHGNDESTFFKDDYVGVHHGCGLATPGGPETTNKAHRLARRLFSIEGLRHSGVRSSGTKGFAAYHYKARAMKSMKKSHREVPKRGLSSRLKQ